MRTLLDNFDAFGQNHFDVAGAGHVGVDLDRCQLRLMHTSVEIVALLEEKARSNVHDREHGKCVSGPWEPG